MLLELCLCLATLIGVFQFMSWRNRAKYPPGEWGLPIIGHLPSSTEPMDETVTKLRKKHGDTFTWRIGARTFVVMCDFKTIKQVFSHPDAQGRPDFYSSTVLDSKDLGLFNSSGELWQTSRRFTMRHLRDLGFGKSSLETSIALEAKYLIDEVMKHTNKRTKLPMCLSIANLNVLWKMVSDTRFELDDPAIQDFQKMIIDLFDESQKGVTLFDMFPYLAPISPPFVKKLIGVDSYIAKVQKVLDYVNNSIDEHKSTLNPSSPRDFIDEFLLESQQKKNDPAFTEQNLRMCISDLFFAGGESTTATLKWILLFLAKYPEVQTKVQQEIDEVCPRDRLPGLEDRTKLTYLEAVFSEVQRKVSFAPIGAMHLATNEMNIDGYAIPEGTILVSHLISCHHDPAYWEKPDEFYPEHFLDNEGKLRQKRDGYLPFSIGRRVCPGESLSKLNLYLFGASLLQNFKFSPAPGEELSLERDPSEPMVFMPRPYDFIITKRE